ncbi:potassium channel family protein [Picrophilus oshimae]|uniref:Voltage-gated potassium channel n=1 Tax=Picrophilus torridus (strain ATCC 700027 / DSM 9790 / JCM 10055 / NBRC 100828 / KAW 2/3) TaxID=1122961 RepID=A0A8G2FY14_PICTO|nr:potassium channel family protein [Picrophilus oshimae]SMD31518.1 voltage-gated potassium channel [Picrophilus oshimae DSM 9789]
MNFFIIFKRIRKITRRNMFKSIIILIAIIIYSVFSEYILENPIRSSGIHNLFTSLWWTMQTITTVGYGDTPVYGFYGRINGMLIMVFGIGTIGYVTASLATILIDSRLSARFGDVMALESRHVIICNFNSETKKILKMIDSIGLDIVILSENEPELKEYTYVKGMAIKERDLIKAGIKKALTVIVFAKNDDRDSLAIDAETILSAMVIKKLNKNVHVIAELLNPDSREHASAFVDETIVHGDVTAELIAASIMNPGITNLFSTISQFIKEQVINDDDKRMNYKDFYIKMLNSGKNVIAFKKGNSVIIKPDDELSNYDAFFYI